MQRAGQVDEAVLLYWLYVLGIFPCREKVVLNLNPALHL